MVPEHARRWQSQVELTLRLATPADDGALADLTSVPTRSGGRHGRRGDTDRRLRDLGRPVHPTQRIVPLLEARADDLRRLVGDARLGL